MSLTAAEANQTKMMMCKSCYIEKPQTDYSNHRHTCKMCISDRWKRWYEANPEKHKKSVHEYYVRNKTVRAKKIEKYRQEHREQIRLWHKEYYIKNKVAIRDHTLQKLFKTTLIEYNEMFIVQNGKCATCGKHQSELKASLHLDHNHETKEIRGLLCSSCNLILGQVKENITTLENMITYLKKGGF